jgi:microcystin-dependent protein
MSDGFLGEIRIAAFGTVPAGWLPCDGRILQISQYQALFSLLSNKYGGDGRTTFGLPNLQGTVPLQTNPTYLLGVAGGEVQHKLALAEMPPHTHTPTAVQAAVDKTSPSNCTWGTTTANSYANVTSSTALVNLSAGSVASIGSGQGHENQSPFLVLSFMIATTGNYPTYD